MIPGFYTYQYLRKDGSPYYVGKGTGKRVWEIHAGFPPPKNKTRVRIQLWPDEATAFAYERYFIDFWGRKDIGTGILRNRTDGGEGASGARFKRGPQSPEHRRKNALAKTGTNNANYGKPRSQETRRKIALAQKGKPRPKRSAETRALMSIKQRARWVNGVSAEHKLQLDRARAARVYGPVSESTKQKMRDAHAARRRAEC